MQLVSFTNLNKSNFIIFGFHEFDLYKLVNKLLPYLNYGNIGKNLIKKHYRQKIKYICAMNTHFYKFFSYMLLEGLILYVFMLYRKTKSYPICIKNDCIKFYHAKSRNKKKINLYKEKLKNYNNLNSHLMFGFMHSVPSKY